MAPGTLSRQHRLLYSGPMKGAASPVVFALAIVLLGAGTAPVLFSLFDVARERPGGTPLDLPVP